MKKRVLFFVMSLMMSVLFMPNVFAKETPVLEEGKLFFAKGTPIVINERPDGEAGALITWEGGEQLVPADASIFGASHESETYYETTSITMNGGQVRNLFGGGLHKSEVGTSNVVVNGGKVVSVQGGGAASFSGTTCHRPWYAGNPVDSPNRVNVAKVTIKNITGKGSIVYGGGEGISYTGVTNVVVSGGTWDYVIAGGSNGFTGNATLDITGGTINTVQSVNRGKMDDARIKIAGGTITNAYVGGDTSDKGVTGTIGNADMDIVGGKVTNVSVGTNGVTADGKQIMATDVANLWYHQGLVTNVIEEGFDKDSVAMTVTLTFSAAGYSEGLEIPIGFSFTNEEVRELEQGMHMDLDTLYFTFGGFYKDEACTEKFDFSKPFDQDTTIYMSLVPREEENPEDKTEEPKVENPDTADINLILILATTVFGSLGLTYTIKKRGFN